MENVFQKYTVLDFTDSSEIGVVCSTYLALHGFRVIRIEAPGREKLSRDERLSFVTKNLNKECITLNVNTEEGRRIFRELLKKADVLIENHPYGYMDELGFGYEAVKELNPKLVYGSIKGYPKGSPWQNVKANPVTLSAMGTATFICGYTGGEPVCTGGNLAEMSTSAYAANGIVAALFCRENDGEGRLVEVNGQESIIAHGRGAFSTLLTRGDNVRVGNWSPNLPDVWPMELYPTKSTGGDADYVIVGALNEIQWRALANAMGTPELADDPRFNTWQGRYKNIDELDEILREYTAQYTKGELMDWLLKENRIVCGQVNTIDDLIHDETLAETGMVQVVEDSELGEIHVPTFPAVYHNEEHRIVAQSPVDAKDAVFKDLLGLSAETCTTLTAQGVIS